MTDPTPLSANEKARLSDWAEGRTGATPVPDFIAREHVRRLLATPEPLDQPIPGHTITPECGPICWTTGHHHSPECDGCRRLIDMGRKSGLADAATPEDPR